MPKTCKKWWKVSKEVYLNGRARNPHHPTQTLIYINFMKCACGLNFAWYYQSLHWKCIKI